MDNNVKVDFLNKATEAFYNSSDEEFIDVNSSWVKRNNISEKEIKEANELLDNLAKYAHAFLLACLMDRQIAAERAWIIPFRIKKKFSSFDIDTLYSIPLDEYKRAFRGTSESITWHRFPQDMAKIFCEGVQRIKVEYNGDAKNIWQPSRDMLSAEFIRRMLKFSGCGIKIANMMANILIRRYGLRFKDYASFDIAPDIQTRRVFHRLGLTEDESSINEIIYTARVLNPCFPGIYDYYCWKIGSNYCHPKSPKCSECPLNNNCPYTLTYHKTAS